MQEKKNSANVTTPACFVEQLKTKLEFEFFFDVCILQLLAEVLQRRILRGLDGFEELLSQQICRRLAVLRGFQFFLNIQEAAVVLLKTTFCGY